MERQRFRELLALASRHLAEARHAIEQQEQLIGERLANGMDTSATQALLEKLRASVDVMAQHERNIEQQIREFDQGKQQ